MTSIDNITFSHNRSTYYKNWYTAKASSATRSTQYLEVLDKGGSSRIGMHVGGKMVVKIDWRYTSSQTITSQSTRASASSYTTRTFINPGYSGSISFVDKNYMTNYSTVSHVISYFETIITTNTWFTKNYYFTSHSNITKNLSSTSRYTSSWATSYKLSTSDKNSMGLNAYSTSSFGNVFFDDWQDYRVRYRALGSSESIIYHSTKGWISSKSTDANIYINAQSSAYPGYINFSSKSITSAAFTAAITESTSVAETFERLVSYVYKTTGTGTQTYTTYYG